MSCPQKGFLHCPVHTSPPRSQLSEPGQSVGLEEGRGGEVSPGQCSLQEGTEHKLPAAALHPGPGDLPRGGMEQGISACSGVSWSHQPLPVTLNILCSDLSPPEASKAWGTQAEWRRGWRNACVTLTPSHPKGARSFQLWGCRQAHIPLLGNPRSHSLSDQVGLQEGILALLFPPGRPGSCGIRDTWEGKAAQPILCTLPRVFHA